MSTPPGSGSRAARERAEQVASTGQCVARELGARRGQERKEALSIRVAIASGIRLYCEGLAETLGRSGPLEIVGTAHDLGALADLVRRAQPDVLVIDVGLPNSLRVVRSLVSAHPRLKVVGLAVSQNEDEVIACAEAGISGYVPPDASLTDLVDSVASVMRGELNCPPRISQGLLQRVRSLAWERPASDVGQRLTRRELEVARLLEAGLTNKEIAAELRIGLSTVKNHVHAILDKLGVKRRGEAAARIRRELDTA